MIQIGISTLKHRPPLSTQYSLRHSFYHFILSFTVQPSQQDAKKDLLAKNITDMTVNKSATNLKPLYFLDLVSKIHPFISLLNIIMYHFEALHARKKYIPHIRCVFCIVIAAIGE